MNLGRTSVSRLDSDQSAPEFATLPQVVRKTEDVAKGLSVPNRAVQSFVDELTRELAQKAA